MKSIWTEVTLPKFKSLNGDVKTDVLIVGGGIAGLLTAYELKSRGIDCIVAEANHICSGIIQNTTAKITSQHGLIYDKLLKSIGKEKAQKYLWANEKAVKKYKVLCEKINCDFKTEDSFVFTQNSPMLIENEINAIEKLGFSAEYEDKTALPFSIMGAVKFKEQASFHPLKFAQAIAKDLNIYENTRITDIEGNTAKAANGSITADFIVIATHFPIINKHGLYFMKMFQQRSYVTAINGVKIEGMHIDGSGYGLSFRQYGDTMLIGCGNHRTGKKTDAWKEGECLVKRYFPKAKVKYRWANQDCITLDGIPYIGKYSKGMQNTYVITGFNKWGMSTAMAAAEIIADEICGKSNEFADVFSPSRSMLKKQLAVNAFESATNIFTFSTPRCPHLGCALKWNKKERSWDCPCHGSRFSEKGIVLDNPAVKPMKKR